MKPEDIQVGRVYRPRKPHRFGDGYDDRLVLLIEDGLVCYDSYPSTGASVPRMPLAKFATWAGRDATGEPEAAALLARWDMTGALPVFLGVFGTGPVPADDVDPEPSDLALDG